MLAISAVSKVISYSKPFRTLSTCLLIYSYIRPGNLNPYISPYLGKNKTIGAQKGGSKIVWHFESVRLLKLFIRTYKQDHQNYLAKFLDAYGTSLLGFSEEEIGIMIDGKLWDFKGKQYPLLAKIFMAFFTKGLQYAFIKPWLKSLSYPLQVFATVLINALVYSVNNGAKFAAKKYFKGGVTWKDGAYEFVTDAVAASIREILLQIMPPDYQTKLNKFNPYFQKILTTLPETVILLIPHVAMTLTKVYFVYNDPVEVKDKSNNLRKPLIPNLFNGINNIIEQISNSSKWAQETSANMKLALVTKDHFFNWVNQTENYHYLQHEHLNNKYLTSESEMIQQVKNLVNHVEFYSCIKHEDTQLFNVTDTLSNDFYLIDKELIPGRCSDLLFLSDSLLLP